MHNCDLFTLSLSLNLASTSWLREVYFAELAAQSFSAEFLVKGLGEVHAKSSLGSIKDHL